MLKKIFKQMGLVCANAWKHVIYKFRKRDSSIVVFGAWGGKTFSDNSRFLFQYLCANRKRLGLSHVIWLTEREELKKTLEENGYECYLKYSKQAKYYLKRAKYHVICWGSEDIGGEYSFQAIRVNLWHGLAGIKGVNYASNDWLKKQKEHPKYCKFVLWLHSKKFIRKNLYLKGGWNDCYFMSTTKLETELMQKYFRLPASSFIEASYPRLYPCVKMLPAEEELVEALRGRKFILYLPTFRGRGVHYDVPSRDAAFVSFLEQNNIVWVEKRHAVDDSEEMALSSDAIVRLNASFDINLLVRYAGLVISDYSSVVFDALFHRIPVFFYTPDFETYANDERGFVLPIEEFMFGRQAQSVAELQALIEEYSEDFTKSMPENIETFRKKFWNDDMDCDAIWGKISSIKK